MVVVYRGIRHSREDGNDEKTQDFYMPNKVIEITARLVG